MLITIPSLGPQIVARRPTMLVFGSDDLADNSHDEDHTYYTLANTLARAVFTTSATVVYVDSYCDLYSVYPALSQLGVRVDGEDYEILQHTVQGQQTFTVSLPPGMKTVEIINGVQSWPSQIPIGTFVRRVITLTGNLTLAKPSPANRIVVYGDSITSGDHGDALVNWIQLTRQGMGATYGITAEAWGYRALYYDANTSLLRAALVAQIASSNPGIIWLAIGTNDYGLSLWTAANFATAYAALLDDLHTALPDADIYCQSPLQRISPSGEGANPGGQTLAQFRTAISDAATARPTYCTYVDGAAGAIVPDAGFYYDGLHPEPYGHWAYADFVLDLLGGTPPPAIVVPTLGLSGYWKLDEASGNATSELNSLTLTATGTPGTTTGKINGARTFSGSGQYLSRADESALRWSSTTGGTCMGWFKLSALGAYRGICCKIDTSADGEFGLFVDNTDHLYFWRDNGGGGQTLADTTFGALSADTWYHVAFGHDVDAGNIWLQINGQRRQFTAANGTPAWASAMPFRLGAFSDGVFPLNGAMDEWGLWQRSLNQGQVIASYNGGSPPAYPFS